MKSKTVSSLKNWHIIEAKTINDIIIDLLIKHKKAWRKLAI
jgi:hypothetical protein